MTVTDLWLASGAHRGTARVAPDNACWSRTRLGSLLAGILTLSGLIAVLQLSSALFMLAVYDHVLPTRDAMVLADLTALVVGSHAALAVLDMMRGRVLGEVGLGFVAELDKLSLVAAGGGACGGRRLEPLDDVEQLRRFLTSEGPCAVFDVLWLPAFIAALTYLHPLLGLYACGAGLVLAGLAVSGEKRERMTGRGLEQVRQTRYVLAWDLYSGRSRAMPRVPLQDCGVQWQALSRSYAEATSSAHARTLAAAALGKGLRLVLQSIGLALGALLLISGVLSPGALFASSLMLARTFSCLDGGLAHWRGLAAARASYLRLTHTRPREGAVARS
ncbi:MAG: hypothetical protein AB7S70_07025 [Hyphomicrobium sp.]|uniref:hypothetical protein n=1 Tax=Hyphomicrobium sp. TaxID=82 RepID=UPI003D0C5C10